jgi:hypothetical protein
MATPPPAPQSSASKARDKAVSQEGGEGRAEQAAYVNIPLESLTALFRVLDSREVRLDVFAVLSLP